MLNLTIMIFLIQEKMPTQVIFFFLKISHYFIFIYLVDKEKEEQRSQQNK